MSPTIYLYLLIIGIVLGFLATWPYKLRLLRPAQMLLLPILLCCTCRAWLKFGPSFADKALSGVILLATGIGLIVTLAPNLIWLIRTLTQHSVFRLEGRYIDEEDHLQPIRNLAEAGQYEEACNRLETLLKSHRADFNALHLLVQIYHQLKKNKRAEQCLLFMLRSASTDEERLASSRLYNQITTASLVCQDGPKLSSNDNQKLAMVRSIIIRKSIPLFRTEGENSDEHTFFGHGTYSVVRIPNPINQKGPAWLKLSAEPWGTAEACWEAANSEVKRSAPTTTLQPRSQLPGIVVAAVCLLLTLFTLDFNFFNRPVADLPALKMELAGLVNQLDNITNHYPLLSTPAQKSYQQCFEKAIYGLDIYSHYQTVRQVQQAEVLSRKPAVGAYFEALNTLDDQLYSAWHQWGLTNREALISRLEAQKVRLLSGDVMVQERLAARSIWLAAANEQNTAALLDFNERLEQEIADTDPTLIDAARENRDCADHAIRLLVKINHLRSEIAKDKRTPKAVQTAQVP